MRVFTTLSTRASKRPAGSISHSYILMIFSNTPLRSQTSFSKSKSPIRNFRVPMSLSWSKTQRRSFDSIAQISLESGSFKLGWMPPHPGCLYERALHDEFGLYSTRFKIAGDFDFLVRIFFGRKIKWTYTNQITMKKMRRGGVSNAGLASKRLIAAELAEALKANGVSASPILQLLRYPIRLLELVMRPKA